MVEAMNNELEVSGLKTALRAREIMHRETLLELVESEERAAEFKRLFEIVKAQLRIVMVDRTYEYD